VLVVHRTKEQVVMIGDNIEVKVTGYTCNEHGWCTGVKLGITAPKSVPVDRKEVRLRKRAAAKAAQVASFGKQPVRCADCGSALVTRQHVSQGKKTKVALCPRCEAPTPDDDVRYLHSRVANNASATALVRNKVADTKLGYFDVKIRWDEYLICFVTDNTLVPNIILDIEAFMQSKLLTVSERNPVYMLEFTEPEINEIKASISRWEWFITNKKAQGQRNP